MVTDPVHRPGWCQVYPPPALSWPKSWCGGAGLVRMRVAARSSGSGRVFCCSGSDSAARRRGDRAGSRVCKPAAQGWAARLVDACMSTCTRVRPSCDPSIAPYRARGVGWVVVARWPDGRRRGRLLRSTVASSGVSSVGASDRQRAVPGPEDGTRVGAALGRRCCDVAASRGQGSQGSQLGSWLGGCVARASRALIRLAG